MVAAATAASAIVLIHGLVTLTPAPGCHVDCTKPAAHVTLQFVRTKAIPGSALATATTDARGRFQVSLAPGTWTVTGMQGQTATPARIVVRAVRSMTVKLRLDRGTVR